RSTNSTTSLAKDALLSPTNATPSKAEPASIGGQKSRSRSNQPETVSVGNRMIQKTAFHRDFDFAWDAAAVFERRLSGMCFEKHFDRLSSRFRSLARLSQNYVFERRIPMSNNLQ
ncbi:MAG TPA: hypothetical protein VIE66_08225, partial [Methylocella sp.]